MVLAVSFLIPSFAALLGVFPGVVGDFTAFRVVGFLGVVCVLSLSGVVVDFLERSCSSNSFLFWDFLLGVDFCFTGVRLGFIGDVPFGDVWSVTFAGGSSGGGSSAFRFVSMADNRDVNVECDTKR